MIAFLAILTCPFNIALLIALVNELASNDSSGD
jgi:hypothetical protein